MLATKTQFNWSDWIRLDLLSAVSTWSVVAFSTLYFMYSSEKHSIANIALAASFFVVFIVLWLISVKPSAEHFSRGTHIILLSLQYSAIIGIYFTVPFAYSAILVTLWATILLYVLPIRWALITAPIWSSPLWFVFSFYWQKEYMFFSALLFMMFNIFALVMFDTASRERKAREQANRLNRELLATQSLLGQATRQSERIRIARNIHDLLGHHLTALSINLQVASRITEGEAKSKIDQCHSLAQLLLSDVREAVSEIRDKSAIELKSALLALVNNIPRLQVELDYDNDLKIADVELADTIIKSVQESLTNSLKHGKATQFEITLKEQQQKILLCISDNGIPQADFKEGNGLAGIRERVQQLKGTVFFESRDKGFRTSIEIPQPL